MVGQVLAFQSAVAKLDDSVGWATDRPPCWLTLVCCAELSVTPGGAPPTSSSHAPCWMEYRGYDSSGIALVDGGTLTVRRRGPAGQFLEEAVAEMPSTWRCPVLPARPLGPPTVVPPTG
ncbi:hypothetical protein ABLN97_13445 [Mycobacterium tuberculosis]